MEKERNFQRVYTNNKSMAGKLEDLRHVFDKVIKHGKPFGCNVNHSRCHHLVKEASIFKARTILFEISITFRDASILLGSFFRRKEFCKHYTEEKADEWNKICINVPQIAKTSPQNAYLCLKKGDQKSCLSSTEKHQICWRCSSKLRQLSQKKLIHRS